MAKCNYPGCKNKATMTAIIRVTSEQYNKRCNNIKLIEVCPYHFCILQNETFEYIQEQKKLSGPFNIIKLIESVIAGKEVEKSRKSIKKIKKVIKKC